MVSRAWFGPRLHTQWCTICLKWENNKPQGISIKFISCTVPQAVGRWGPPLCSYFRKSSCVMTLPRCKWTRWGQRTERLDWWRPFLVRKKQNKKTWGPCGNTVLASRGSNIKQTSLSGKVPPAFRCFSWRKKPAGGISQGSSSFGRSAERVKGLIGNVPFFSCCNLARARCRPKCCQPRLHHSYGKKNLSTHRM